jgi:hypothetical protein
MWDFVTAVRDFRNVAALADIDLHADSIEIESLAAPHRPPSRLPTGKMAVYVFSFGETVLKVGKAGPKSQARYISQHYNPQSASSTLAASILADDQRLAPHKIGVADVGMWIKTRIDRVNLLIGAELGIRTLSLLEAYLHCRLKPRYEGFKSQF